MTSIPRFALSLLWVLTCAAASGAAEAPPPAVAALRAKLDAKFAAVAAQGATYGVRVVALGSGEVLYSVNADGVMIEKPVPGGDANASVRLFLPASNMKLITTAAALDALGADFAFRTVCGLRAGDLVVVGSGDPAFGDPAVSGDAAGPTAELARWAAALKARGVVDVGAIVLDDTVFEAEFVHPSWPRDQLAEWYCAPVGGLNLQTNCLEVKVFPAAGGGAPTFILSPPINAFRIVNQARTGGTANVVGLAHGRGENEFILRGTVAKATAEPLNTAVRDPGMFFGHALLRTLTDAGIRVRGGVKRAPVRAPDGTLPADLTIVAEHKTPLPAVLARCNKRSQNMYAESLFKALGANHRGPNDEGPFVGSWARGSAAVDRFLNKLHLPDEGRRIADGSGLSRDNAISPMLITEVLRTMHGSAGWPTYRDSLAVAGVDGTLARRLREPGTKGNVLAKTGFIRGVSALSGYVRTMRGEWLAFSILFNDIKGSTNGFKEIEDEVCRELVRFGGAPEKPAATPAAGKARGKR